MFCHSFFQPLAVANGDYNFKKEAALTQQRWMFWTWKDVCDKKKSCHLMFFFLFVFPIVIIAVCHRRSQLEMTKKDTTTQTNNNKLNGFLELENNCLFEKQKKCRCSFVLFLNRPYSDWNSSSKKLHDDDRCFKLEQNNS